jgi:hypothetical protein
MRVSARRSEEEGEMLGTFLVAVLALVVAVAGSVALSPPREQDVTRKPEGLVC